MWMPCETGAATCARRLELQAGDERNEFLTGGTDWREGDKWERGVKVVVVVGEGG